MCEGGNRRVTRMDADGHVEPLVERFEGKRFNRPNDVVCRSDGSVYFTDPGLRAHEVFTLNERAAGRRSRRYTLAALALAAALVGSGVVLRSSNPAQAPIVDVIVQKYQPYWEGLVQKVQY